MAISYFINWIVAAETNEGGKLFKGGNYLRKYGKYETSQYLIKSQYYFVSNFADSLESKYETNKQSQNEVSDIILRTNSIVEKVDLTQTQLNGKITNNLSWRHLLLFHCIVIRILKLKESFILLDLMFHNMSSIQILQLCVLQKAESKSDVLCSNKTSTYKFSSEVWHFCWTGDMYFNCPYTQSSIWYRGSSAYTVFWDFGKTTVKAEEGFSTKWTNESTKINRVI